MVTGSFAKLPLRFGRYQVEKLLGKGAMGAVYLARDTQLDRLVALKIPKLSASAKGSEKLLKRLKTEAMAAAQIDHPSVCPVFDSGDIDGIPFIAMQYVEGETLKDHLKNQAKTPQEAVALISQLAEGLAEAHSRKIYHRDLKPENIKLNRRGVPVIMDFGLAKLAATLTADAGATQKGSILGSPAYMSPEQASGKVEEIDHRSDIYALGVMLYEMLTGTWPFSGSAIQVMGQKSVLEPPSPLTVKPELNPQLAAVCQKLIARKREDRYQTAQEVLAALALIDFGGALPAAGTQPPFGSSTDAGITDFLKEIAVGSPKAVAPKKAPAPLFGKDKSGKNKKKHLLIGGGILGVLALLAGLVISFRTKEGTLVVTVNEPDAEVEVLNEAGEVEIKRKGDKGPITISVDPGKHRLKVQKDGFEFFSKDFEITSRGTRSITAKLVPLEDKPPVTARGWHGWPADAPPPAIPPFDAERAKKHQDDWAAYLKVPVEYTNSIGMKFILIPPGEFTMGSTPAEIEEILKAAPSNDIHWQECNKSEGPRHTVILTQPVYLGIHEVIQADYEKVLGKNPSHFAPTGAGKGAVPGRDTTGHPVEMVSWNDAAEFCAKLSQQEQLKPFYFRDGETVTPLEGTGYRLPREAEWEFACRAGTTTKYWIGETADKLLRTDWCGANSGGRTHAAGELSANPFGLFDVHGNVCEWVQDCWGPTYYAEFTETPAIDPVGPSFAGALRVGRGNGWGALASGCRSANRCANSPAFRNPGIGFRVSLIAGAVSKGEATKPVTALNGKPAAEFSKEFEASVTFLADLSPVWKTHMGNCFSTDGTIQGRKYVVQGKESPHGIFLHPPLEGFSEIVYTLNRAFEKFESGVAIPGQRARAALTFEVIGDDTVLWTSKPIQEFNQPQSCEVNVKKVNTLTLRVHCPGSDNYAHAVWLEPRLFATGLPPPKWDVERSAAEWVLSLGGTVGIRVERQERGIAGGGTLPAENFVLERIDLRNKSITGADLARLEGLTSLHKLFLADCRVGDAGLAHLKNLTGLSELFVFSAGISDAGLAHLQDLTNLRFLGLFNNREVTDAGLPYLAKLMKLQHLDLNATGITSNGLEHVRKLSNLRDLNLMGTAVNDDGMPFIEGLTNLRALHLQGSKIGDAGLARLKGLTNLRFLNLKGTLISDAGLAHLKGLTNLEQLALNATSISDAGLEHLETLPKLNNLEMCRTKVSDEGLRHVARLTGLVVLGLDGSNVSDAGIDSLLTLRKLHYLHVNETRISAAGFARLKEAFPKADLAWSLREDK